MQMARLQRPLPTTHTRPQKNNRKDVLKMAIVKAIPRTENNSYGDLWGKNQWQCLKCGKIHQTRWEAIACCKPKEGI
jgi:hypothetical protein